MPSWRTAFKFEENEDVDFATVHHRYRERMMELSGGEMRETQPISRRDLCPF